MQSKFGVFALVALLACPGISSAQESRAPSITDIVYAVVDGRELALDLYLPDDEAGAPLLVWIHGGAWQRGSKETINTTDLVGEGFAIASVDFRNSVDAPFPAQIHDIKAAIRFLRAKAGDYGYDASRIGIHGRSSGGHLTALVGTTNGHSELEGEVGEYLDESSDVQAVVSYFGASNLNTILPQSTATHRPMRTDAVALLLGASPEEAPELAALASPVTHVDASDPPMLLLHGDQDPQMPINQAHELHGKYKQHDLPVSFEVLHGAAHGGDAFFDPQRTRRVAEFLHRFVR